LLAVAAGGDVEDMGSPFSLDGPAEVGCREQRLDRGCPAAVSFLSSDAVSR
jgi:hypothetical protein